MHWETIAYRAALVVIAAVTLAAFWQLDLALQTLRAVSTPQGSTAFLARRTITQIHNLPLFDSSLSSSSTRSAPSLSDAAANVDGERVLLHSMQPGAKVKRDFLATQRRAGTLAVLAADSCDRAAASRFAFAPGTLSLWCVAGKAAAQASLGGHRIQLVRVDASRVFDANGTGSSSSSSSALRANVTASVDSAASTPIVAPFLVGVAPDAGAVEVMDVLELTSGVYVVASLLLHETVHGSVYSSVCSAAVPAQQQQEADWSCTGATLLWNGNNSAAEIECRQRALASTSTTLVATCNFAASSADRSRIFIASLSLGSRSLTQQWAEVSVDASRLSAPSGLLLRHVSPIVSLPTTYPVLPSSSGSGGGAAPIFVHTAFAVFFPADQSSTSTSTNNNKVTAAMLDLTSAAGDFASPATVMSQSETELPRGVCVRAAQTLSASSDYDGEAGGPAARFLNCSCCTGWVLDPQLRSVRLANGSTPAGGDSRTDNFISLVHPAAAAPSSAPALLHVAVTFRSLFVTADSTSRRAFLLPQVITLRSAELGAASLQLPPADGASVLAQSWSPSSSSSSAATAALGPSFFLLAATPKAASPSSDSSTSSTNAIVGLAAIYNGTEPAAPVRFGFLSSAGGAEFRCAVPAFPSATASPADSRQQLLPVALGIFANRTADAAGDALAAHNRLFRHGSVVMACPLSMSGSAADEAASPAALQLLATDGGSWSATASAPQQQHYAARVEPSSSNPATLTTLTVSDVFFT